MILFIILFYVLTVLFESRMTIQLMQKRTLRKKRKPAILNVPNSKKRLCVYQNRSPTKARKNPKSLNQLIDNAENKRITFYMLSAVFYFLLHKFRHSSIIFSILLTCSEFNNFNFSEIQFKSLSIISPVRR